jgi:hypothetical protein
VDLRPEDAVISKIQMLDFPRNPAQIYAQRLREGKNEFPRSSTEF